LTGVLLIGNRLHRSTASCLIDLLHFGQIITLPGLTRQHYNEFRDSFTGAGRIEFRDLSPDHLRQCAAGQIDIIEYR